MNLSKAFSASPTPLMNYQPEGLGGGFNTTKQSVDPAAISAITSPTADVGLSKSTFEVGGYEAHPA